MSRRMPGESDRSAAIQSAGESAAAAPHASGGGTPSVRFAALRQLVKFNLVGVLNTAVDFGVFALLQAAGVYYLAAQCISYTAGVVNSYLLNKYWTFGRGGERHGKQAIRFVLVNGLSFGASLALLYLLSERLGLPPLGSKVIVVVVTTAINFAGSKLWVFR